MDRAAVAQRQLPRLETVVRDDAIPDPADGGGIVLLVHALVREVFVRTDLLDSQALREAPGGQALVQAESAASETHRLRYGERVGHLDLRRGRIDAYRQLMMNDDVLGVRRDTE